MRRDRKRRGLEHAKQGSSKEFGLFRNPPRALRTEIIRYLREREADPEWFDSTVLVALQGDQADVSLLHVAPGERLRRKSF